ncbi:MULTISPECIES: thioredoxin family protein [unclassified Archaeoglobus]|uniref:thioredoxin family protein n=1 Tax=unclassified Archaeoglobus TaxID=2643606 RepID=UPI0025C1F8C2|nr:MULTISPECIES: thioredoxin family protein [unclassified Archaeoglobus]
MITVLKRRYLIIAGAALILLSYYLLSGLGGQNQEISGLQKGIYYFYSPNCHYCQQIEGFIEQMSQKYSINYCQVEKLSGECEKLANYIGLRGVPTVAIVDGKVTVLTGVNEVLKLEDVLNDSS